MEILAPLGLIAVGWLARWGWEKAQTAAPAADPFLRGYHSGWHDALAAVRRACGEETTATSTTLADAMRAANERMQ